MSRGCGVGLKMWRRNLRLLLGGGFLKSLYGGELRSLWGFAIEERKPLSKKVITKVINRAEVA